jgi:DNA repair protein RadD
MTELRPYQHNLVAEFERKIAADIRRIFIVAPTGGGKTIIASEIIKRAIAAYK